MSESASIVAAPPTEIAPCPLCGARESSAPLAKLHDAVWAKPGEFALVACEKCGHGFLSPRPPREAIGFYYKDLYSDEEGMKVEENLQHSWIARRLNGRRLADLVSRKRPATGERHLDVGCGVGAFLLKVAGATGATAVGVDFDPKAADSAERHGKEAGLPVEVHRGTLADQAFAPGEFATASMIHFLEHSFDPRAELAATFRDLESGGAIVVEVPSLTSLGRRVFGPYWLPYLAPQHISLFSRATLVRALEEAGFQDVRIRDSWAPLVWTISFVLWYHRALGGRSRFAKNGLMKLVSLFLAFTWLPFLAIMDVFVLSFPLALLGRGDHIRATALKP